MVDLYMEIICIIKVTLIITLRYQAEVLLNVERFHGMCVWNLHVLNIRVRTKEAYYLQDLPSLCNPIRRALPPCVLYTHFYRFIWVDVLVAEIFHLYKKLGNLIPIKVFMVQLPRGFKCIIQAPLFLNNKVCDSFTLPRMVWFFPRFFFFSFFYFLYIYMLQTKELWAR